MEQNKELAERLARQTDARVKACWDNSYNAMWCTSEHVFYIEGYVAIDGFVTEHGWLEIDGQIVDVTLYAKDGCTYFPGLRYSRKDAYDVCKRLGELPIFYSMGWGGCDSPEMMRAYCAAYDFIGASHIADMQRHRTKGGT